MRIPTPRNAWPWSRRARACTLLLSLVCAGAAGLQELARAGASRWHGRCVAVRGAGAAAGETGDWVSRRRMELFVSAA